MDALISSREGTTNNKLLSASMMIGWIRLEGKGEVMKSIVRD